MNDGVVIRTDKLVRKYPMGRTELVALKGVSLTFQKGEFAGLVGPSGSGKTTLLNIIGTLDAPSAGSATVLGQMVEKLSARQAAALRSRQIGFIFKGIAPAQRVLALPTGRLADMTLELPVLIGSRMARSAGLSVGDYVTVQWRDVNGAFDARDGQVVEVMHTSVGTVDWDQVWVPLERLQALVGMPGEATLVTMARIPGTRARSDIGHWSRGTGHVPRVGFPLAGVPAFGSAADDSVQDRGPVNHVHRTVPVGDAGDIR
ncbi:ATP-binding cassette domain-containing protein, partial [candidate division WOR-3 bacterium]|nr:ATP-binding cassette domain-containing protein [candidate division WOR-3 bacterium]